MPSPLLVASSAQVSRARAVCFPRSHATTRPSSARPASVTMRAGSASRGVAGFPGLPARRGHRDNASHFAKALSTQGTPSQDRRALSTITNSPRPDSSRSRKVPDSPGSATPSDCAPPPGLASPSLQDLVTPRRAPAIASGKSNSATPHARRASRAPTLSHSAEHDVAFGGQSYQELQELRAQYRC